MDSDRGLVETPPRCLVHAVEGRLTLRILQLRVGPSTQQDLDEGSMVGNGSVVKWGLALGVLQQVVNENGDNWVRSSLRVDISALVQEEGGELQVAPINGPMKS